jgi:hypothetical protein
LRESTGCPSSLTKQRTVSSWLARVARWRPVSSKAPSTVSNDTECSVTHRLTRAVLPSVAAFRYMTCIAVWPFFFGVALKGGERGRGGVCVWVGGE